MPYFSNYRSGLKGKLLILRKIVANLQCNIQVHQNHTMLGIRTVESYHISQVIGISSNSLNFRTTTGMEHSLSR